MSLTERLAAEIGARGPITFAAFMEAALYDPAEGFFTRAPVGRHFATAPHVSPVFAALMAEQVRAAREELGAASFTVVEAGAGDGTLARALGELLPGVPYLCVERDPAARAALSAGARPSLDEVGPFEGVLLANELLDNLPFHRLRERDGRTVEVFVGARDGSLVEIEAEPTPGALAALASPLAPGEERPVSPAALAFVRDVARVLRRGYAFLIDYGFARGETPEPVRSYREHRLEPEVLADPGRRDVTGPADLDAIAAEARRAGLCVWGPVSQRDALHALGYRDLVARMQREQREAEAGGDHRRAVELWNARGEASMLLDPAGLGAHRVVALGTAGLPEPRATRQRG